MGVTTGGFPYPEGTDKVVDGDNAIRALAEAVDLRTAQAVVPTSVVGGTLSGSTVTFSAASAVNLNGIFTSRFYLYLFMWRLTARNVSTLEEVRLRRGAVDVSTGYTWRRVTASGSTVATAAANGNASWNSFSADSAQNNGLKHLLISGPALAERTMCTGSGLETTPDGLGMSGIQYYGLQNDATASDGLTLSIPAPSMTGRCQVFGLPG